MSKPQAWSNVSVAARECIVVWVVAEGGQHGFGYGLGSRLTRGAGSSGTSRLLK